MRDLNPRPPQCECGALSAELIPQQHYYNTFLDGWDGKFERQGPDFVFNDSKVFGVII